MRNIRDDFSVCLRALTFRNNIEFLIDTGADISCCSIDVVPPKFQTKLNPVDKLIYGPDGGKLTAFGYLNVKLERKNKIIYSKIYVLRDLKHNLLGKPETSAFDLMKKINSSNTGTIVRPSKNDLGQNIFRKFPEVFNGLGRFDKELKIHLVDKAKPFSQSVPRGVAIPLLPKLKKELNRLMHDKVIVPVDFPTDWCSPIVVVPKKNSEEIRLCCDYTKLNNNIKRPIHLMPSVEVTLAKMKGSKFCSRLDANAGFHQLKLDKQSQHLTTFITPFGRFMYKRLPFGINCASDYFSKHFGDLLSDIPNVAVHVDDILVFGETREADDSTLEKVLTKLSAAGVTLNKDKCTFGDTVIDFLGHRISQHGIDVHPDRVSSIVNFPTPRDKKSLMQFLGTVNYAGKYIPNKSQLCEPLNSSLQDGVPFVWLDAQQRAFSATKEFLKKSPTLAHYDFTKKIIIQADASSYGLGSALVQENNDKQSEIVAYASRTLSTSEKNYSQIEKEALALAFAAERFKNYILGVDITLETDHKPLLQILQTKTWMN